MQKLTVLNHGVPESIGRFSVRRRLARGGMSEIFLVDDPEQTLSVPLVVKRLAPFLLKRRYIEMFLREAKISSELNHKNVVRCFESGYDGDMPFLVLEYLEGMTVKELALRAWTDKRELDAATVSEILKQSAQGLAAIHEKKSLNGGGLVHRDISPENLFVTSEGVVKVLDLGIARGTEATEFTKTGELKGKIPYMSPEQVNGDPLDARSDLFSLGVTAYWLLTKDRPFSRSSDVHTLNAILSDPPARFPHDLVKSKKLEKLVYKLLEKSPAERVQSAKEITQVFPEHNSHLLAELQTDLSHIDITDLETFDYSTTRNLKPSLSTEARTPATKNVVELPVSRSRNLPLLAAMMAMVVLLFLTAFFLVRKPAAGTEKDVEKPTTSEKASPVKPKVVKPTVSPQKPKDDASLKTQKNDLVKTPETKDKIQKPRKTVAKPTHVVEPARPAMQLVTLKGPSTLQWSAPGGNQLKLTRGQAEIDASTTYLMVKDLDTGVRSKVQIQSGVADHSKHPSGKLVVRALPYATVRLGKTSLGVTPFEPTSLKAGRVEVILEYENKVVKKWIEITPGKTTTLKHNFNSQ